MDIEIEDLGGSCPVQGSGLVWTNGGEAWWYFRARGRNWYLSIWVEDRPADSAGLPGSEEDWFIGLPHGEDQFGAGYMSEAEAERLIRWGLAEWERGDPGGEFPYPEPQTREQSERTVHINSVFGILLEEK